MVQRSEGAAALRRALTDPIYNKTLRKDVGRGELDYEVYVRTRELLALQTPVSQLVHPDELLFQVMHQTQELWLKCAAFEVVNLVEQLDTELRFEALGTLGRIVAITRAVAEQIRVLATLAPAPFQIIRRSLGNGSGLESPGYNQILAAADEAERALQRLVDRRGATLAEIYSDPASHADLHRIAECFVDWDSAFQTWLFEHFMLVRRTIGVDRTIRALDGFPTVALGARMTKPLFPALWNIRVELTHSWKRDGGFGVGEVRDAVPTQTVELEPPNIDDTLRAEFPLLSTCVYLSSNSAGATPRAAKQTLDAYWSTIAAWRDEAWGPWMTELDAHADALAALVHAQPGSVICDSNVATLLSRVLSCFDYRERPRVVTSDLEFPSVPFALRAFARYGLEPVVVPSDGIAIDAERIAAAIDERTQLVCLSHATFATGALVDLEPIVRRAREYGALVVLDAYQSVGVVPVDVGALDVDFLLGGAHKWLCGSYESAFLYIRPALLPSLEPAATGWIAAADPLSFAPQLERATTARRFAGGTPAVLPSLFSRPGLTIVRGLGVDRIRATSLAQTDRIIALADDAGLPVATPRDHARRGGIVTLRFPGDARVRAELLARGFVCSHRGGIRIAPHFYNTQDEIDRFMGELARLAREVA